MPGAKIQQPATYVGILSSGESLRQASELTASFFLRKNDDDVVMSSPLHQPTGPISIVRRALNRRRIFCCFIIMAAEGDYNSIMRWIQRRRERAHASIMAAEGDNNFIRRYVYRGEEGERIPREATHITVINTRVIQRWAFLAFAHFAHENIVEVIFHEDVEKIEHNTFANCRSLRRVIMRGVNIVERGAFYGCTALTDFECDRLEIIEEGAFGQCYSLRSINLLSARIVKQEAFNQCRALTDVTFSQKLETVEEWAFGNCVSVERITLPLKDGIISSNCAFIGCENLRHVDLVEREELLETIAALHLENWRNDMKEEIDSINRELPSAEAGGRDEFGHDHYGGKTRKIRRWIRSVLHKINHYQVQHQHILNEARTTLQLVLPGDIAMNNVLPYLALPSYTELSKVLRRGDDFVE